MDEEETGFSSLKSGGLTHMLGKSRSRNKKNRDSASFKSVDSDGRASRASLSSLGDKFDRSRPPDYGSEQTGIKMLLPKALSSKRRQKEREQEEIEREEAARGRKIAERGILRNDSDLSRLGTANEEAPDGGSMLTYESDLESPNELRPSLSQHASHAGYLTTSSPLIHATTFIANSPAEAQSNSPPRAHTCPSDLDVLATTKDTTLGFSKSQTPSNNSQRSVSPVGRLKDAFVPRQSSKDSTSPERRKPESGIGSSQVEGDRETDSSRRASIAAKLGSILPESRPTQVAVKDSVPITPEKSPPAKIRPIDTHVPPRTPPPTSEDNTPIIVNTPPTPTNNSSSHWSSPAKPNTNVVTSASGNMISHRRMRSGSIQSIGPSRLSNVTSAPLTPMHENGPAPIPSGFFSTVFSAAQNAASTLSSSITNTSVAPLKSKSGPQDLRAVGSPEVETLGGKTDSDRSLEEKELAVKTLGTGDLSLSHLGISDTNSGSSTHVSATFLADGKSKSNNEDGLSKNSTALAGDNNTTQVDDVQSVIQPRSIYGTTPLSGEQTPPNGNEIEAKSSMNRSGSIRSALGKRRHRGSSTATGTTIGAAIAAANASVARPSNAPKITGFAVASKKRNRDFHQLFRSVPDDDYLIEDYSCALQREILAHGRLYVSEGHLCFNSNIFGWVTTLVMSFDEIVSVEKRSTALVFKNGLLISTLHAKNIFASFTSRDSTYDLIVGIWKLGHPSLRSSLNGVLLNETGGDKTEKTDQEHQEASPSGSDSEDGSGDGNEVYDEDEEGDDGVSFTNAGGSVSVSEVADKVVNRKSSTGATTNVLADGHKEDGASVQILDFPGPLIHPPTECTDQETHYPKLLADEVIPAPLGKIYSLMFGPASPVWMRNWLIHEQRSLDLTMDDKKFLGSDNKVRTYSYIKPLNAAIGPKQTKCLSTEVLDFMDLEKAVSVTIATQTPDVPSGNVFCTKTKYCLSWAEGNATRLQMNCTIEWTGKSWLKGPIEKGANDGQASYARDVVTSLRAAVTSRRSNATTSGGNLKKKSRKGNISRGLTKTTDGSFDAKPEPANWGILEPARLVCEPVLDIVRPLFGGNFLYITLGVLLLVSLSNFSLFGSGRKCSAHDLGMDYSGRTPARLAAYEEMWRKEESELWDWLEDRVGMEKVRDVASIPIEKRSVTNKLKEERMGKREVEAAIRVTEEKLSVLRSLVEKKKKGVEKKRELEDKTKEREAEIS